MQYGITYRIYKESSSVHIQGLGNFKVHGLDQILNNAEMATADLVERNGDYFLHVVAYVPKAEMPANRKAIGIDLGIKNQIAFSNGIKVQYAVPSRSPVRKGGVVHYISIAALHTQRIRIDRDKNAAINIFKRGRAGLARTDGNVNAQVGSVRRQQGAVVEELRTYPASAGEAHTL